MMIRKITFLIFSAVITSIFASAQQMPIDFSDSQDVFTGFSGTNFTQVTDPLDNSNEVGRFQNSGGAPFEGSFIDLVRSIDLNTNKIINMRVYVTDNAAHTFLLKLEQGTGQDVEVLEGVSAGNQNTWIDLSFDFANAIISGTNTTINADEEYSRLTLFIDPNFNQAGIFLVDDIDDGSTPTDPNVIDIEYTDLVWSDEFDSPSATRVPINAANWFHQTQLPAGGSWFNGEVQHYTDRLTNSYMQDGFLHIVAKRETFTDQGETKQFTSARLNSKFAFTYGRVDVRAKLPFGDGTWPAIWTLGKNVNEAGGFWQPQFGTTNWPACGEIDIMEHGLGATNHVSSALHTPSSFGNTQNVRERVLNDVANNFYVYSMNWSPNQITFLIDDIPFYTYNPAIKDQNTWPYDADQYMLLNVAMGGIAGGIDPNFQEGDIVIDYVRVYQNTASVGDEFENAVQLYPNPVDEVLNIQSIEPVQTATLFDLVGTQVLELKNVDRQIDLQSLDSGIYLLQLEVDGRVFSRKVVKR